MKKLLMLLPAVILINAEVIAQGCVVCTKTASELDKRGAESLNMGIVYLAALPLIILFSLGYIWWRNNKASI